MLRRAPLRPQSVCRLPAPAPILRSAIFRSVKPLMRFAATAAAPPPSVAEMQSPKPRGRKPATPIVEMDPNLPATPMPSAVFDALMRYQEEKAIFPHPLANPLGTGAVPLPVIDWNGNKLGSISASAYIFGSPPRADVIHTVVKYILAKRRSGTASTKGRSEVRGGGKKPWGQKKTGRARAGSIRSPLWKGGGKVHTPKPRSFEISVPKKIRKLAMRAALSIKRATGKLVVLDNPRLKTHKTREFRSMLENLKWPSLYLMTGYITPKNLDLASRNVRSVDISTLANFNVYDIMRHDIVALSRPAVGMLERMLAPPKSKLPADLLKGPFDPTKVPDRHKERREAIKVRQAEKRATREAEVAKKGKKLWQKKRGLKAVPEKPVTPPTPLP